jgi:hypothetical protein
MQEQLPTTAWMQEVEQCRSNCRVHEENHVKIMSFRQLYELVIKYFQTFELQNLRVLRGEIIRLVQTHLNCGAALTVPDFKEYANVGPEICDPDCLKYHGSH